jgi:hypothetical protein
MLSSGVLCAPFDLISQSSSLCSASTWEKYTFGSFQFDLAVVIPIILLSYRTRALFVSFQFDLAAVIL